MCGEREIGKKIKKQKKKSRRVERKTFMSLSLRSYIYEETFP